MGRARGTSAGWDKRSRIETDRVGCKCKASLKSFRLADIATGRDARTGEEQSADGIGCAGATPPNILRYKRVYKHESLTCGPNKIDGAQSHCHEACVRMPAASYISHILVRC